MNRYSILILLLFTAYIKTFGQNDKLLPQPDAGVALDSTSNTSVRIICSCSHNSAAPLFLLKTHHRTFVLDSLSVLNPNWIKNIYVIKKQLETKHYEAKAKAGVVLIIMDDKNYPEAYKELKHKLKKFKPNFSVPEGQS